jgi:hypothetical protein
LTHFYPYTTRSAVMSKLFPLIMTNIVMLAAVDGGPVAGANWRVIPSDSSSPDVVVAGCDVRELGAKGDGATDDTPAFTAALKQMSEAGDGTVDWSSGAL